jgi:hypothetical protein
VADYTLKINEICESLAREAIGRASAGRSVPSQEEQRPGLDEPMEGIGSDRTTQKNPETP